MLRWFQRDKPPEIKRYIYVDQLYADFKYVIATDIGKHDWWHPINPFGESRAWAEDNGCKMVLDQVIFDRLTNRWMSNSISGEEFLFVATNDIELAMFASMKWT